VLKLTPAVRRNTHWMHISALVYSQHRTEILRCDAPESGGASETVMHFMSEELSRSARSRTVSGKMWEVWWSTEAIKPNPGKVRFREHRGSLADSLATVVEIGGRDELVEYLRRSGAVFPIPIASPHLSIDYYAYDDRIGWDTYMVSVEG
jgi:hypothetical protein